jgi:hypothetical protein
MALVTALLVALNLLLPAPANTGGGGPVGAPQVAPLNTGGGGPVG